MTPALHMPLDLDLREPVRRLGYRLKDPERAIFYVFRLWQDWGRCATDFRPLQTQEEHITEDHPWEKEELAYVIEGYCCWKEGVGGLIRACLLSGVMALVRRDADWGLVLTDFWSFNEHLSPSHKTIQQMGAMARHAKRHEVEMERSAGDQARILEVQRMLPLEMETANAEERKRSVLLMMRLDRACGIAMRRTTEYTHALLALALDVVRKFTAEEIAAVEGYLIASREKPEIVKVPDRVLSDFAEYVRRSHAP